MLTTEQLIQEKAYELGYEKCGIIPISMMNGYKEKFAERIQKVSGSERFYKGQERLVNFSEEYPWAKSVIVLTVPYSIYNVPEVVSGHIAKSYLFDIRVDEKSEEYQSSRTLEGYLQKLGLRVASNQKFGIVSMRWAAMEAGLGVVRRNNFFYTESGSWVHLEAWLTDREMELIGETKLKPCPKGCDRCIKACPTASLSEAYTMNPLKCISFLTTFGGRDLPHEPLAQHFGECVYGCDICQNACPMNHRKWVGGKDFPGLAELAPSLTAENILNMDEEFYKQKIQPKFFYLSPEELWKWQVNALNYMNNQFQDSFKPFFLKACKSKYREVREMAATICEMRKLCDD